MSRQGIIFFHSLGHGWVLDKQLIQEIFPGLFKPPLIAENGLLEILQDVQWV